MCIPFYKKDSLMNQTTEWAVLPGFQIRENNVLSTAPHDCFLCCCSSSKAPIRHTHLPTD